MNQYYFSLVAGDTDGLAFKKQDQSPFTPEEQSEIVENLNKQMDALIRWENDGQLKRQIVVAAKNYIMQEESGKVKIKGSGLKATTKEKALQKFTREVIDLLLDDRTDYIQFLYMDYAKEILNLKDISQWCSKHTVTKSVLNGEGTTQVRLREALRGVKVQEGDKFYTFFRTPEERCLGENFDGQYDENILLKKLYDTLKVFESVVDLSAIPNLTLKKNKHILEGLKHAHPRLQVSQQEVFEGI